MSRCELENSRLAMWYSPELVMRMSGRAAGVLEEAKKLDIAKLQPLRTYMYTR